MRRSGKIPTLAHTASMGHPQELKSTAILRLSSSEWLRREGNRSGFFEEGGEEAVGVVGGGRGAEKAGRVEERGGVHARGEMRSE